MARIIVSAGHTSVDPGMINGDLKEVDLTRKIANAVIPYLRSNGVITLSVPPELDLVRRIEWINATGYRESLNDIAVEIHINDGGKSGLEAWYKENGQNKSQQLAETIIQSATTESGLRNQGIKSEYQHELGSLAFVHNTNPISALIECLYIDNPEDQKFLRDQDKINTLAKGIAKGILKFLNIEFKDSKLSKPQETPEKKEEVTETVPAAAVSNIPAAPAISPAPVSPAPMQTDDTFQNLSNTFGASTPTTPSSPTTNTNLGGAFNSRPTTGGYGGGSSFGGASNTSPGSSFGGGGSSFGGGGGSSFGAPAAGSGGFMQNREERKKMIDDTYQKVLGRNPNQNDLNYFLNIGITEDQLIKRMIDSQEHSDLVKARKDVIEITEKFNEQKDQLLENESRVKDQEEIIKTLNTLLSEKNQSISELRGLTREKEGKKRAEDKVIEKKPVPKEEQYKPSFSDRVFKFFSDIFE